MKPASEKTHAGLGGNAIFEFSTGKLGVYHNIILIGKGKRTIENYVFYGFSTEEEI